MSEKYTRKSIGKAEAIRLFDSGWWKDKTDREIAVFQMFTEELAVPFGRFQEAMEKALGRPVWTHELGLNWEGLAAELMGDKPAPTMQEIIELIPKDKRLIIVKEE